MRIEVLFWLLALEHFKSKLQAGVQVTDAGCWEWQRSGDGRYGHIHILGVRFKAHVAAAILWRGIVLRTRVLRHQCDNAACCNPEHVKPGTQKQNRWEASERGRVKHGITARTVARIRRLVASHKKHSNAEIARRVGVHPTTVMRIRSGKMRARRSSENLVRSSETA